ncbi:SDR family NAD(P)-dependent oxidoreductase [Mycolicibacterium murale]|nr:type I polyketide synthase [Mycolicibacterium murale]MCV7180359.1 SDR family NAD(P)-dependent oxidoreductase [Mycolicibacterium murale]
MTEPEKHASATPVAVIGMTAIYPGEPGLDGYWRTVIGGRDAIGDVPPSHWLIEDYFDPDPKVPDRTYCKRGGFIDPVLFDPVRFGLPPNALPSTDSAQILALIAARKVLDEAMRGGADVDLDRVDVVLGVASTTELVVQMGSRMQRPVWRKALLENGLAEDEADTICQDIADNYPAWQESTFPGLLGNVVAGRVANRLDLGGSNFVVDAACASSLSALQTALHRLYLHESDLVLTGGVDALNDVMMYMCFSKTPAFSPTGDCRPFSDGADGTIIGEGVGMLALKRLDDAERDGDVIHAVIRGLGSSSDGRASSVYAPRSEGQAKALRRAYERAGYAPTTVELVEAHGTATKAGDVAEFAGLKSVFTDPAGRCALGSVKSQIGHTKAAAGAAGLIKAILALQHSTLPGTLKVDRPNPALELDDTPFYLNATTRPWIRSGNQPRRAGVSSFGFGGSNFHVTVEEYRGAQRAKRLRTLPSELVLISAGTEAELGQRLDTVAAAFDAGASLARIAYDCARVFDSAHPARAGLVAADTAGLRRLIEQLGSALAQGTATQLRDPDIAVGVGQPREGRTAFLFPGQGSQYVGMGADLALAFPAALQVWDDLAGDLADLHRVVFPEPAFDAGVSEANTAALTAMENAQPAIATTSRAQLALLELLGVTADAAAGHSFGEVTALAAAGVLPVHRLAETARTRGLLMAEAGSGQDGAMLAVTAGADTVRALLDSAPADIGTLVIANDNAPTQVVVAGHRADISWVETAATAAGLTTVRLPVASAFHSPIVASSSAPLTEYLTSLELGAAAFPVYANATAQPYGQSVADQLGDQVRQPVRFREMIEAMSRDGINRFIEVGPGRVLTRLVDQILDGTPHKAVALDDPKVDGLRGWHRGLAALAADGVALDLAALFEAYEIPDKHNPPPAHAVRVGGANLGKPYPPADGAVVITPKRDVVKARSAPAAAAVVPSPEVQPMTAAPLTHTPVSQPPVPKPVDPAAVTVPTAAPAPLSQDAWSVIDRLQRETADQHQRYLDAVAESHQAFLGMATQMMAQIVGNGGPEGIAAPALVPVTAPVDAVAVALPSFAVPSAQPPAPPVSTPPTPQPATAAPAQVVGEPVGDVVLSVVSEKTGYPVAMLGLEMEMEAELGIDSIKQVEILAALQSRFPGAPQVPASELARLRTLQDVVDTLGGFGADEETTEEQEKQHDSGEPTPSGGLRTTEVEFRSAPPSGLAMAGLRDGEVFITGEDPEFAAELEQVMTSHEIKARVVDAVPEQASAVISLAALGPVNSAQDGVDMHLRAFRAARSVATSNGHSRLFVTVQSTGGRFRESDVALGVASLAKTAAWEWPNGSVRAVDMETLDAQRLTAELLAGGSGVEVALRDDGSRLVAVDDAEMSPMGENISVDEGGVVVVTGGARGVTARSALALAQRHGLQLALLGRTDLREQPAGVRTQGTTLAEIATALVASARERGQQMGLPEARSQAAALLAEQEVRDTLAGAEQQGTTARYFAVDIADRAELGRVLDRVRQDLGPIVGVVHGAGVLADRRLEDLDEAQFTRVFATKVMGAEALLSATATDHLRFISLFSSIAARAGNPGQSAYAAANAALETIAARESVSRGCDCVVRAFGWGPWDGGMVDATLKSRFLSSGVDVIPLEEGAQFFADHALRRSSATAIVVAAPAQPRLRTARLDWDVSTEILPMLMDHQVRGRVVVPVVMVLDAMLRAAEGLLAGERCVVQDFQVLSGVTFADREKQELTLDFEPAGPAYTVTVTDGEGRKRYRAAVVPEDSAVPRLFVPETSGADWPMSVEQAYIDRLFHGPRFAALDQLGTVGPGGGTATVKGLHELGWPQHNWAIDAAAVDGGLQLGILWAGVHGRPLVLPVRIGRAVLHRPIDAASALQCRLAAYPVSDKQVDFDIVLESGDGQLVAELAAVEFYVAGSGSDSSA